MDLSSRPSVLGEFRDLEFQERLHRLNGLLFGVRTWKSHADVKRHLDYGLARRLQMLEHSLLVMAQLPPDRSPPLALHQVEEANVALNALYLNIRGSLDNTAWALTYHYELVEQPNESKVAHRQFAHLFGKQFLAALARKDAELAAKLQPMAGWGRELSTVRDPAAHRIPLYIPPSVVDAAGAQRVAEIDRELESAATRSGLDDFHSLMMKRWNSGVFRPVVGMSEQEGLALLSLPKVLNRDVGSMLNAIEHVVAFVFAEDARPLSTNYEPLPQRDKPTISEANGGSA